MSVLEKQFTEMPEEHQRTISRRSYQHKVAIYFLMISQVVKNFWIKLTCPCIVYNIVFIYFWIRACIIFF